MYYVELKSLIAKKMLSKGQATTLGDGDRLVETVFETILEKIMGGDKVNTPLGSFHVHIKKARVCKNPKTGESVNVPEKKVIKFKFAERIFSKEGK